MAFKAPAWFGNHVTNKATARWLGRNQPATGAGATRGVGATVTPDQQAVRPAGQTRPPSDYAAQSFNPHPSSPNSALVGEEDHAPANTSFAGLGIAPYSAFR